VAAVFILSKSRLRCGRTLAENVEKAGEKYRHAGGPVLKTYEKEKRESGPGILWRRRGRKKKQKLERQNEETRSKNSRSMAFAIRCGAPSDESKGKKKGGGKRGSIHGTPRFSPQINVRTHSRSLPKSAKKGWGRIGVKP